MSTYSPIAQLVERLTVNQNVRGSSPRRGAKFEKARFLAGFFCFAALVGLILDDFTALHDERKVVSRVSQHRNILERFAINQQDIGDPAFPNFTEISVAI